MPHRDRTHRSARLHGPVGSCRTTPSRRHVERTRAVRPAGRAGGARERAATPQSRRSEFVRCPRRAFNAPSRRAGNWPLAESRGSGLRSLFALAIAATLSSSAACDRDPAAGDDHVRWERTPDDGAASRIWLLSRAVGSVHADYPAASRRPIRVSAGAWSDVAARWSSRWPRMVAAPSWPHTFPQGDPFRTFPATQPPGLKAAASLVQELRRPSSDLRQDRSC